MPRNILNLPSYAISRIEKDGHDYHIWAEASGHPSSCQYCGRGEIVGFGRREQLIRDLPMHGKRVGIHVDTRRYRCRQCGKTFYEHPPDVDERRLMTSRLVDWVGKQSIKRPFTHLSDEVGLAENTIKNVFRDYINELERTIRFEVPRWMGIGDIHIIRKPRCIISNIERNTAVEVLGDRTKRTVMTYFQNLKGRENVRYVTMDMWTPYRESVQALMSQATIVVDKFHVVRMANEALESVRKAQRAGISPRRRRGLTHDRLVLVKRRHDLTDEEYLKLAGWTANYPVLRAAYDAKEAFCGIWDMKTRPAAERAYEIWKGGLTSDVREAFRPLVRAVDSWWPHIFAYFDYRVTHAYAESPSHLLRVMNRLGRGYSFEAVRAKILFAEGSHQLKRPSLRCRRPDRLLNDMMVAPYNRYAMGTSDADREINYGADISTLVRLIEDGKL